MSNRLEWLSSWDSLEAKARTNNNENELKTTLEKIRIVLSNNPLPEETASAKVFLDSLKDFNEFHNLNKDQINEETKKKLWNLNDEYVIFQKTKTLLIPIKPSAEVSPEVADSNSNFEKLFAETKSDMILDIKKIVSDSVNEKFKDLKPTQRENIKTAIASKLTSSWIADSLVWGFSGKIKWYWDLLAKKDYKSLLSVFDEDKDSAKKSDDDIWKKFETLLNGQLTIIDSFIQKNKTNPNLDNFLNSPINVESITATTDINSYKPSTPEEEQIFLNNIKDKIKEYDSKIQFADKTKEQIFDQVTNLPDFMISWVAKFIAFFASLPIIGNLIKSFLGLKWDKKEDIETEIESEFEMRKSTKNLQEYWIQTGKNWEKTATQKDQKIKILEDKDLSSIKHKQLDKFFAYCKEKQVKVTSPDFWYNVFEIKKIEIDWEEKDGKKTKTVVEFNINIDENDFDTNKKPQKTFFEKLNSLNPKKIEETQKPESESSTWIIPASWVAAWISVLPDEDKARQKPATPEETAKFEAIKARDSIIRKAILDATVIPFSINYSSKVNWVEYPEVVSFDSSSQFFNIWNQKYKFSIPDFKTRVPLFGEIDVKNAKIDWVNISWENFVFTSSWEAAWKRRNWDPISKTKKEIWDLTCILLNNWRFTMKDWNKQINITKV